jgi:hypothetical protein
MNPAQQFDMHPDAEILNGLVENALPDAERAQVLAHLGGCGRCRQIVYLAQDATPVAEAPAKPPMAEPRIADGERAWILRWKTGWAAAFAFATVAAIAVIVSIRHSAPTPQIARLAPSPAPAVMAAPPPAAPIQPSQSEKKMAELQAIAPAIEARKTKTRAPSSEGAASSKQTLAAPAPPTGAALLPQGGPVLQSKAGANSFAPSTPLDLNGAMKPGKSAASTAVRATRFQSAPEAFHGGVVPGKAQASGSGAGMAPSLTETVEVNVNSAELQAQPAAPAPAGKNPPLAAGAAEDKKSGLIVLPSGLPLVSTAELGHTQLAIDAMGTLFLSKDRGKSWQPVERQWTGRLMKVHLAQAPKDQSAEPFAQAQKRESPASATLSIPAALFEIVNDRNAIWTSADGQTWTAK